MRSALAPVSRLWVLLSLSGLACQAVLAATDEQDLEAVFGGGLSVSIATGSRQALRRAPAVATVITAQDIAAMGATDLDQVLESVPGLHVSRNNQTYSPLYVIRGVHSELNPQTLVLLNGVPLTTLLVGSRGVIWGGLPLDNVARIEVIRGPGSALYGADAVAGVINIITKTAADAPGTELGARVGSFRSRDGWLHHGGRLGPLDVAAYLRVGHTDGFKKVIEADAQTGLDQLFGTRASLAPGPVNNAVDALDAGLELGLERWRLRASYKRREDMGTGAGIAAALDPVGKGASERLLAELSLNDVALTEHWRASLTASYFHYVQDIQGLLQLFGPGAFGGAFPKGMLGAPHTWERQWRMQAVTTYTGLAGHQLRAAVGFDDLDLYRTQEFKNFSIVNSGPLTGLPVPTPDGEVIEFPVAQSFLAPHRRQVRYAYLQDEWRLARDWTFTGGVRHDRFSDFGSTTNPRLALVWDARLDLTLKLLYGTAFRAPSFNEQYGVNPVASGNPRLRPERVKTLEAAAQWSAGNDLRLDLSAFRYRMHDIIRTVANPAPVPGASFQNTGSQHGRGLELELAWEARRTLKLVGHYAWQRSTDLATGADAGYAPRHHLWGRADWTPASGWQLSGQLNHVAGRQRPAGDLRAPIADYTTFDLTLRPLRGRGPWEFSATVLNLFDAEAREPSQAPGTALPNDLPMAGRSFQLQLRYRL